MKANLNEKYPNVQEFFDNVSNYRIDQLVDYIDKSNVTIQDIPIMIELLKNDIPMSIFISTISLLISLTSAFIARLGKEYLILSLIIIFLTIALYLHYQVAKVVHNNKYRKALLIYKLRKTLEEENKN